VSVFAWLVVAALVVVALVVGRRWLRGKDAYDAGVDRSSDDRIDWRNR
jgi:hypothetical protein